MRPEYWLGAMLVGQAAAIMVSYEMVYRHCPDKPWAEVILGTLIWFGPGLAFVCYYGLIHPIGGLVLVSACLVTGGAMMSWIFMVKVRDNAPQDPRIERMVVQISETMEELRQVRDERDDYRRAMEERERTAPERMQHMDGLYILAQALENRDVVDRVLGEMQTQLLMMKLMQEHAFRHPDEPKALREFREQAEAVVHGR